MADWIHNIEKDAYIAGLKVELATATDTEHKKAIQAELESVEKRTAVKPSVLETA